MHSKNEKNIGYFMRKIQIFRDRGECSILNVQICFLKMKRQVGCQGLNPVILDLWNDDFGRSWDLRRQKVCENPFQAIAGAQ
jgi:hypothetical protein